MSGLYLHIPFCRKACNYCDFHFSTSTTLKTRVVNAMHKELALRAGEQAEEKIKTIYFGGGTPSMLSREEFTDLMNAIRIHYRVDEKAEITLEANPDDFSEEMLENWTSNGVNRISIGVQSFHPTDLLYMERVHDAMQAEQAIRQAQRSGIQNITIDLIYGTPGLSHAAWKGNLEKAVSLEVPHISAYALTVEENTPLFHRIRRHQKKAPDENHTADQFLFMADFLEKAGYLHYEVSNFALPGMESRHNSAYWENKPYLGVGPSAHSYKAQRRRMNVANNARYIAALESDSTDYFTEEILNESEAYNEYLLTRLRTRKGVDRLEFSSRFGEKGWEDFLNHLDKIPCRYLLKEENRIRLNKEGWLQADGIAATLFR